MVDRTRFIASAAATFELLEVFGRHSGPLSVTFLATTVGRPKSSVHRALATLVSIGVIEQDARTSLYQLTLKLWRIGVAALANLDIVEVARPELLQLMTTAEETVHLSMPDDMGNVIYVTKVESPRSIHVRTQLGKLNPSFLTATGRAILAFREDLAAKVLSRPLEPSTPLSTVDPVRVRDVLREVARKGIAIARGENNLEIGGIAAPIRDQNGDVIAACGLAIPIFRMDRRLVERCTPLVKESAAAISSRLGHQIAHNRPPKR